MATTRPVRICLAASSGGHLRQLLDLQPFWEAHDVHFVTEDTPLAKSLLPAHRVHLVAHFRLGQLRTHRLPRVASAVARNCVAAWRTVRDEKPNLVVSTGAGSVFPAILFAKMRGAKFVLIESFARFESPSRFARLGRRFADVVIVQSASLGELWPDAEVFDPLVTLGPATSAKEDLGLVTVGTLLPFDRLVEAVDSLPEGIRPTRIVAQVGKGGVQPNDMETRENLEFDEILALLQRANFVFCHGGTGSLITALRAGCRIVAMPRRQDLGENHDDHQQEIVSALSARGLIEVAAEASEMKAAVQRALVKQPQRATTDPVALIERLRSLMSEWFPNQSGHYSK